MEDLNDLNTGSAPGYQPPSQFRFMFTKMTSDMRFVGIFTIIYGALTCLSIIGALLGVPMIFIGLRMREAADKFDQFRDTNDSKALRAGFELQGKFFNIQKILIIIGLVLIALYIIFFVVFFGMIFSSIGGGYSY
jgi:hypothetical protein